MNNDNSRTNVKKKRVLKNRFKIIIPLVILLLAGGSYFWYLHSQADSAISESHDDIDRDKSDLRSDYVDPKFDNVSILLMGIDASDTRGADEGTRTDALMVATLNKDDKSVKLLSIPRDALVYIPEVGREEKINHAHSYGGTRATIDTVEDTLDGISVDVPYEFKEQDSTDKADAIHLYPGYQELNGEEALALARTRKMDTDVDRGKRQQEIIEALVSKTISVKSILKYDDIIEAIGKNMKTNMTFTEMKSFFSYATHGSNLDIETLNIDGYDYQPNRTYYWKFDEQ